MSRTNSETRNSPEPATATRKRSNSASSISDNTPPDAKRSKTHGLPIEVTIVGSARIPTSFIKAQLASGDDWYEIELANGEKAYTKWNPKAGGKNAESEADDRLPGPKTIARMVATMTESTMSSIYDLLAKGMDTMGRRRQQLQLQYPPHPLWAKGRPRPLIYRPMAFFVYQDTSDNRSAMPPDPTKEHITLWGGEVYSGEHRMLVLGIDNSENM
jgi:hypothetical protein